MKKIVFIFVAIISLALDAYAQNNKEMKTLVTYFSASGVTRNAATQLANIIGADIYEIQPAVPYTSADLDWTDKNARSTVEMHDLSSRPAIKGKVENIDDYHIVYIGFPIWWYTAPTIINTFIEAHNLSGKTLIPFATSGGSTIKKSCEDLRKTYPNLKWKDGRLLNHIDKKEIEDWRKE